jgi:hypothetical protein
VIAGGAVIGSTIALTAALAGGASAGILDGSNDLPINPEWLANTISRATNIGNVENNVVPGAIAARDDSVQNCKPSNAHYPACKQEYVVVWAGKQNAGDVNSEVISALATNATINPQGLADQLDPQFLPGLDGFVVLDARREDPNGKRNPLYGKVVNFVQMPLISGIECEPHHMQYQWENGQNIMAGCLFTDLTNVMNVADIPNLKLVNTILPTENPFGSVPDAYDAVVSDPNHDGNHIDDTFVGTYMGGPDYNFAGSPGSLVSINGETGKQIAETRAGSEGQILGLNVGAPNILTSQESEVCNIREARPIGSCANPHGIQAREDLGRMVTADYAEPREIILDPVKTIDKYAFRPTVRAWDISGDHATAPVQTSVARMPETWRDPEQRAHVNIGIMEDAKTNAPNPAIKGQLESKGMFSGSMCGGGVFFTPDITTLKPNSTDQWKQVWDDGFSALGSSASSAVDGTRGEFEDEPGGCAGGAWHQVTPNNKYLYRSVQGRAPIADNYFDQGAQKMVYSIDISHLINDGQDGTIDNCDLLADNDDNGVRDGIDITEAVNDLKPVGDPNSDTAQFKQTKPSPGTCPTLKDVLIVHDPTNGGPHWAAFDNHQITENGDPTRLFFTDYFVSRSGVDGDHRGYMVNIDENGNMTYDKTWRDEATGSLGTNFNRRNWPGSPDAGFYKPHSELWVCPPNVCPDDEAGVAPTPAPAAPAAAKTSGDKAKSDPATDVVDKVKGLVDSGGKGKLEDLLGAGKLDSLLGSGGLNGVTDKVKGLLGGNAVDGLLGGLTK